MVTNDRSGAAEPKAGDKKSGKCATFGGGPRALQIQLPGSRFW